MRVEELENPKTADDFLDSVVVRHVENALVGKWMVREIDVVGLEDQGTREYEIVVANAYTFKKMNIEVVIEDGIMAIRAIDNVKLAILMEI